MSDEISCARCGQAFAGDEGACPVCGWLLEAAVCDRHADRRALGACVICGSAVCELCDDGGRPHFSCPTHRDITVVEGWAQVYSTGDDIAAALIRDNLRSDGIDAAVLSQRDRSFALELGDLSPVRVLVPAFRYEEARELLDRHKDASGEVRFACPACGEAFDVVARSCASCGHVLN